MLECKKSNFVFTKIIFTLLWYVVETLWIIPVLLAVLLLYFAIYVWHANWKIVKPNRRQHLVQKLRANLTGSYLDLNVGQARNAEEMSPQASAKYLNKCFLPTQLEQEWVKVLSVCTPLLCTVIFASQSEKNCVNMFCYVWVTDGAARLDAVHLWLTLDKIKFLTGIVYLAHKNFQLKIF